MGRIWKGGGERVNRSEHIVQNPQRTDMNIKKDNAEKFKEAWMDLEMLQEEVLDGEYDQIAVDECINSES